MPRKVTAMRARTHLQTRPPPGTSSPTPTPSSLQLEKSPYKTAKEQQSRQRGGEAYSLPSGSECHSFPDSFVWRRVIDTSDQWDLGRSCWAAASKGRCKTLLPGHPAALKGGGCYSSLGPWVRMTQSWASSQPGINTQIGQGIKVISGHWNFELTSYLSWSSLHQKR